MFTRVIQLVLQTAKVQPNINLKQIKQSTFLHAIFPSFQSIIFGNLPHNPANAVATQQKTTTVGGAAVAFSRLY